MVGNGEDIGCGGGVIKKTWENDKRETKAVERWL